MGRSMGLDFGLDKGLYCKRKWRWLFTVPDVCADGIGTLPPQKSARPDLKWKEIAVQHISEQIYLPGKPEWSLVTLTLYDVRYSVHPVFKWLEEMYQPENDAKMFCPNEQSFIKFCYLQLFDGCGNAVERWEFEDVWPQSMNFHELDMGAQEFVVCDVVLRYARAYIKKK